MEEGSLLNQLTTEKSTLEGKLNQHYSKKSKGYFIRPRANQIKEGELVVFS